MTDYVYAIFCDNFVKIGVSNDPKKRAGKVSADCPHGVRLLGYVEGGYELETFLHGQFAQYRVKGEWFSYEGPIVKWAESLPDRSKIVPADTLNEFFKANRGMQTKLADLLGLRPSTISQWKAVPVEYLPEVAEFTGISREELLPDAFRPARENAA